MKVKLKILEHVNLCFLMLYLHAGFWIMSVACSRAEFELLPSALAWGIIIQFAVELRLFLFPIILYPITSYYDFSVSDYQLLTN